MSDSALPSPGGTACAASPPSALNNSCAKWDIVPHAAKDTSCEGAEAGSAQGSIPPCEESPRSTVSPDHFQEDSTAPAQPSFLSASTPSKTELKDSARPQPETPASSATKRPRDAPPTPATEERNMKRQRVPSSKFRMESPSPPPVQRKKPPPKEKAASISNQTPVPDKIGKPSKVPAPSSQATLFHTDKAALRDYRRQNE
ncbi:hypothetical protein T484DRAFT_1768121 [Baffinella frigidus]|nr:hypothetical protein T484DRAFT_1768121 [Cryptophyta sp. CCMP2293]